MILIVSLGSALGLLLLSLKLGGRKVIGMDILFDVLITLVLIIAFMGTFSGMASAMIGGLFVTIILFVMKKTMVHERLKITKKPIIMYRRVFNVPKPYWEKVEPDWRKPN